MYNILIADDHPLFREAICNVIRSGFPGCTILETADLWTSHSFIDTLLPR